MHVYCCCFIHRSEKPVVVPIKPFEMPKSQSEMIEFRVRNVNAAKQVWQPSGAGYQQPSRDHFGNGEKKTICGNTTTFQTLFHLYSTNPLVC